MTAQAPSLGGKEEASFLQALRAQYEASGFSFVSGPHPAELPEFFGGYVPDAIARKPGHNVAIELKRGPSRTVERSLGSIRQLFEGRSDWQLRLIVMGSDPAHAVELSVPDAVAMAGGVAEVRSLLDRGYRRPAFIMAWALLEAALRTRGPSGGSRPHLVGSVIQSLAMKGLIEPETETRVRGLVQLRNRIVHGDLGVTPTVADVELLLSAIDETLRAEAA